MYHQETDYALLLGALARLDNRIVVDVGAERGSFVDACLTAGSPHVYACEPYPPHVDALRRRFAADARVTTLACAIGPHDETATLHIAHDPTGQPYDYHHSLVPSHDSAEVRWDAGVSVPSRTLASLVADGTLPRHVGILKVDTEGGDLGVLQGMGTLEAAVVMVEYWEGLPQSIGDSPYKIADVLSILRPRGYREFLFIKRHDEFEIVQWDSAHTRAGDWGNLVFVHEDHLEVLRPVFTAEAAESQQRLVDRALWFRDECARRLETIEAIQARIEILEEAASKRLEVITALHGHIEGQDRELARAAEYLPKPVPWISAAPDGEAGRLRSGRPRVSVVTPSFNHAKFLEETIRSVLDQDYPDLEYIIIDGGSTDGSVEIIERYASRVAYWVSERDKGQADAINKGFARATGDIIAWLNSDDLFFPGAIAAAVAAFAEDPARGLVYGRGHRIDEHGGLISDFEETRPFDFHALAHGVDYILQPTTFMRRQALHEVGPLDHAMHFAFDWDLWLRLGQRYPAVMLDRLLAASREYAATKTASGGFGRTEEIRQLVRRYTNDDVSVGYLNYLMNAILEALPASRLPEKARLSLAVAGVTSVCDELLREERFVERAPHVRPIVTEVRPHSDGWAGPDLRWNLAVPPAAAYLCLRGTHEGGIAHLAGPLVIHAKLDRQPLGTGIIDAPGAFTVCWPLRDLTSSAVEKASEPSHVELATATSFVPSRFHESTDHRALAFQFDSLTCEIEKPNGAIVADDPAGGVIGEMRRRLTPASAVQAPTAVPALGGSAVRFARRVAGSLRRRARRLLP